LSKGGNGRRVILKLMLRQAQHEELVSVFTLSVLTLSLSKGGNERRVILKLMLRQAQHEELV
jgi:hypothetical protein